MVSITWRTPRQIHDAVESVHVDLIGRSQRRMLIEQRVHLRRDGRIPGATVKSALAICGVCGAPAKGTRQDDDERRHVKWPAATHSIGLGA